MTEFAEHLQFANIEQSIKETEQSELIAGLPIDNPAQALAIYNLAKRLEKAAKTMMKNVQTFAQTSPDTIVNERGLHYLYSERITPKLIPLSEMTEKQVSIGTNCGIIIDKLSCGWRFRDPANAGPRPFDAGDDE